MLPIIFAVSIKVNLCLQHLAYLLDNLDKTRIIWSKKSFYLKNAIYWRYITFVCYHDLHGEFGDLNNEFNFSFLTCSGHSFLKLRISFEYCKQIFVKLWNRKTISWTIHIGKMILIIITNNCAEHEFFIWQQTNYYVKTY